MAAAAGSKSFVCLFGERADVRLPFEVQGECITITKSEMLAAIQRSDTRLKKLAVIDGSQI